jgi:hypothetical protein
MSSPILPSFSSKFQDLLLQDPPPPIPYTFAPLDFVHVTFPSILIPQTSRLHQYLQQLRRTLDNISSNCAFVENGSIEKLKSSIEAMFDYYEMLMQAFTESMLDINQAEMNQLIASSSTDRKSNELMADLKQEESQLKLVKLHFVNTLRALRTLHVYIEAIEILPEMMMDLDMASIRICFHSLIELRKELSDYHDLPFMKALDSQINSIKIALRLVIFQGWKLGVEMGMLENVDHEDNQERNEFKNMLSHTTRLIELSFTNFERQELVNWFTCILVKPLVIPKSESPVTMNQDLNLMFTWLYQTLKSLDVDYAQLFPTKWYVDAHLARKHFEMVQSYIKTLLTTNHHQKQTSDVAIDYYNPLLLTIQFEEIIRKRWPDQSDAELFETDRDGELFVFQGYLSNAFEPIFTSFISSEQNRFKLYVEEVEDQDNWEVETSEMSMHFTSADKLFMMIQKSIQRYSKILSKQYFLLLFQEFYQALLSYIELLYKYLPRTKKSSQHTVEQISMICATINTNDYIQDRCKSLQNSVLNMIGSSLGIDLHSIEDNQEIDDEQKELLTQLKKKVNFELLEEQIQKLNYEATHILALSIVSKVQPCLTALKEGKGFVSTSSSSIINDENKYMKVMKRTLKKELESKTKMSCFAYLCQLVVTTLCPLYLSSLKHPSFKINELIAQQMLMNLQELKHFFSSLPDWQQQDANDNISLSSSVSGFKPYLKIVQKEFLPLENILKILTMPNQMLIETMRNVNQDITYAEMTEILDMRNLSSSEQNKLFQLYNKSQPKDSKLIIQIQKKKFMGKLNEIVADVKKRAIHKTN